MKSINQLLTLLTAVLLLVAAGCEYDGPTAMWDRPYEKTNSPQIASIDPAEALPGVNTITINGTGFSPVMENNKVYIDGARGEILSSDSTAITIRRPVNSGDSTTIKVVNLTANDYASFSPYKVTPVEYIYGGGYLDGSRLSTVAVDKDENVYLVQHTPRIVYKITPSGEQTMVGNPSRTVTDVIFDSDGQLVILCENRTAYKLDTATGIETEWFDFSKRISCGNFDDNGNFYTGGRKTGLWLLNTNREETDTGQSDARNDDIQCIRVYDHALYMLIVTGAPDENTPEMAVWKCPILDAAGHLGPREVVLDWAATGDYAESQPVWFEITASGALVIASDNASPLLMVDPETGSQEVIYKDILGTPPVQIVWGTGTFLYMIQGIVNDTFTLRRVDTGIQGAPYYGR